MDSKSVARHSVDIGIVVPLKEEFEQLYIDISSHFEAIRDDISGIYWYTFTHISSDGHQYYCVAAFVGEMGEVNAALMTARLLEKWQPHNIVVLGIAAGISTDVRVGDVVAATVVDSYLQNSKAVDSSGQQGFTFQVSGEPFRSSRALIEEVRHFSLAYKTIHSAWQDTAEKQLAAELDEEQMMKVLKQNLVRNRPIVELGHVASGPTVGAARSFIDFVKSRDRKFIALEMESGGVLQAIYNEVDPRRSLVLRGVSDYGDERKDDLDKVGSGALRRYAVSNAIQFLWRLMETNAFKKQLLPAATDKLSDNTDLGDRRIDPAVSTEISRDRSSTDPLQELANPDPLVCLPAAKALKGKSELADRLIEIPIGNRVIEHAVREVLSSTPERSAEVLIKALAECEPSGETWGRALRASHYFSPAHQPFAKKHIFDLIKSGKIEVERHTLAALGRIGCFSSYLPEVKDVLSTAYGLQKCYTYALQGASMSFVLVEDEFYLPFESSALLDLIQLPETRTDSYGMSSQHILPLGECNKRHVDIILKSWLESENKRMIALGLDVLGKLRLKRTASKIQSIWQKNLDNELGEAAANALWCIGEPISIKAMLDSGIENIIGEGLMTLDDESFDKFMPQVLAHAKMSWYAYRAIGLRADKSKLPILRAGLSSEHFHIRGTSALALARLGEKEGIKEALEESIDSGERVFTALAALVAGQERFETLEHQLRKDLAVQSYDFAAEAQADIISSLEKNGTPQALSLAEVWKPFYGKGDIHIALISA